MEISTPRQLPKTNTKYSPKKEVIFDYRTGNRQTEMINVYQQDWASAVQIFMECSRISPLPRSIT